MKIKIVFAIMILILSGCGTTYNYFTLENLDDVNWVVESDSRMNNGKPVTRCIGQVTDSLGRKSYLMETKNDLQYRMDSTGRCGDK